MRRCSRMWQLNARDGSLRRAQRDSGDPIPSDPMRSDPIRRDTWPLCRRSQHTARRCPAVHAPTSLGPWRLECQTLIGHCASPSPHSPRLPLLTLNSPLLLLLTTAASHFLRAVMVKALVLAAGSVRSRPKLSTSLPLPYACSMGSHSIVLTLISSASLLPLSAVCDVSGTAPAWRGTFARTSRATTSISLGQPHRAARRLYAPLTL